MFFCASTIVSFLVSILALHSSGIWRTHIVAPEKEFFRIPQDIPVNLAATLTVNPETAYRMMKIFVTLKPGMM